MSDNLDLNGLSNHEIELLFEGIVEYLYEENFQEEYTHDEFELHDSTLSICNGSALLAELGTVDDSTYFVDVSGNTSYFGKVEESIIAHSIVELYEQSDS